MRHYVYGLRLRGDPECRYIGITTKSPEARLASHLSTGGAMPRKTAFAWWLIENRCEIEAFKIAAVDTRDEALGAERTIVALVLRLKHRLFNHHLVPSELRLPTYRETKIQVAA